jgi:hypothetical protein
MAIYVDNARIEWRGRRWCHMVASSLDELHAFAIELGLRSEWFQESASYPHYDITLETRAIAIAKGAIAANRSTLISAAKQLKLELSNKKSTEVYKPQLNLFS